MLSVKIHQSYRKIVAVCDAKLVGKRFEQGKVQLDVKKSFYGGDRLSKEEVIRILQEVSQEDATFNFVGSRAVSAALNAGIINKDGVSKIKGIPYALSLL